MKRSTVTFQDDVFIEIMHYRGRIGIEKGQVPSFSKALDELLRKALRLKDRPRDER